MTRVSQIDARIQLRSGYLFKAFFDIASFSSRINFTTSSTPASGEGASNSNRTSALPTITPSAPHEATCTQSSIQHSARHSSRMECGVSTWKAWAGSEIPKPTATGLSVDWSKEGAGQRRVSDHPVALRCVHLCLTFLMSANSCSTRPSTAAFAPVTPVKLTCAPVPRHPTAIMGSLILKLQLPAMWRSVYQVQKALGSLCYDLHPLHGRGGRGEQHLDHTAAPSVNE